MVDYFVPPMLTGPHSSLFAYMHMWAEESTMDLTATSIHGQLE